MIAKVITKDNREYYSHVFGLFGIGFYEFAVTFDNNFNRFDAVNLYITKPSLKRKVFIVDTATDGWSVNKTLRLDGVKELSVGRGYDWLVNNERLLLNIIQDQEIEDSYVAKAKQLNAAIETNEWNFVQTTRDAESLLEAAFDFHDAVMESVSYQRRESYEDSVSLKVHFTRCWQSEVTLTFSGDVTAHFTKEDMSGDELFCASVLFDDGFVYWVEDEKTAVSELTDEDCYFKARSLKWKIETFNE